MNRIDLPVRIQIRRLIRREEHESFVACKEAVDIIVEIMMLHAGYSQLELAREGQFRTQPRTSPEDAPFFDLPIHRFTCCRTRFPAIFGMDGKSSLSAFVGGG